MLLNGPAIVEIREAKGMSQYDLAEVTGIPQPTLSGYETGRRGQKRVPRGAGGRIHPRRGVTIAEALGVPLSAITIPDQVEPTEAA